MNKLQKINDILDDSHSKKIMASYRFGNLVGQFIEAVFMVITPEKSDKIKAQLKEMGI